MAKTSHPHYLALKEFSTNIANYSSILSLLHWDQETYMPSGGHLPRTHQIALLSTHIHELKSGKQFRSLLEKLIHFSSCTFKVKGLSRLEKIAVLEWLDEFLRLTKLPASFVKTFAQVTAEASQIWHTAKQDNNFQLFQPILTKILELNREKAAIYGYKDHPYDALLAHFEPCVTSAKLKTIFTPLRKNLISLLNEIREARPINDKCLHGSFDPEKQMHLGQALLKELPMDLRYTRLDLSAHPFSIALHPHDSRITTRIAKDSFVSNLLSVLHEAGHSFYEMGVPAEQFGTPLAETVSLSIHESQSRFWETLIGRSLPFWKRYFPLVQKAFPSQLGKVSVDHFYKAINRVTPSLIRVEADEVTYCLHIILRFELEMDLINGTLEVADLPDAWRAKTKEIFGIVPKTDSEGCLQDIHWSMGAFGYFPTYALGNLFAAQFFQAFAKEHPDWEKRISQGDLAFIRDWLKVNIHSLGKQYDAEQLAKRITGRTLHAEPYCHYLRKKYSEIYSL
jgi:carboxypeptidase Taq